MNLDFFDCSCTHCKKPHDLKTEPRVGMDWYCKSCGRLNRIKGLDFRSGKMVLIMELIEDDEFGL